MLHQHPNKACSTLCRQIMYGPTSDRTAVLTKAGTCSTKVTASCSVCAIFSRTITTASRRRQKEAVDSFST